MLICDELKIAIDSGDLVPLPMHLDSDTQDRTLLLSKEIQQLVCGPYLTDSHAVRASRLWADMETFVRGEAVSICLTPKKAKGASFGLLGPTSKATWDFRSRTPAPSLRVLGHFAQADTFVALTWWPKRVKVDWSPKSPIGDDDMSWRIAIHECNERWFEILPNSVPLSGLKGESYVSDKLHIVGP